MYDLNAYISSNDMQTCKSVFAQILETYLVLPHRLKPIFDHCKKIESVMVKALKS